MKKKEEAKFGMPWGVHADVAGITHIVYIEREREREREREIKKERKKKRERMSYKQ
jgi:hypothetical protein